MNWDRAQGSWRQFKGRMRQRLAMLTDDHTNEIAGSREVLVGKLQEAYGIGKEEAGRRIKDWRKSVQEVANDAHASPRQFNARR